MVSQVVTPKQFAEFVSSIFANYQDISILAATDQLVNHNLETQFLCVVKLPRCKYANHGVMYQAWYCGRKHNFETQEIKLRCKSNIVK